MDRLLTDWTRTPYRFLSSHEIERLFMQLLDELGFDIEYRQTEEDVGPRSFTNTEYRLTRRKGE